MSPASTPSQSDTPLPPIAGSREAWIRDVGLLDRETDEAFDRLVETALAVTGGAVGYVCLFAEEAQFLRGGIGLAEPFRASQEASLAASIGTYATGQDETVVVEDVSRYPAVGADPVVAEQGLQAFLSVPLIAGPAAPIGAFCVADVQPHRWSDREVRFVDHLAASAETEVTLRIERWQRDQLDTTPWASDLLLENTTDVVTVLDAAGTIRFASPSVGDVLGYAPDALEGASMFDYVHPEDRSALQADLETARQEHGAWPTAEFRVQHADGTWRRLESRGRRLPSQVDLGAFLSVSRDVTETRRLQQKVQLLATAIEEVEMAVLITGPNLDVPGPEICYVNEAMTEMTGYREAELLGRTPRLLQGPQTDRELLSELKACLARGEAFVGETVNYRKDETPYHVRWRITPILDEAGEITHFVSVQQDITAEKERKDTLEQRVQERTRELRSAQSEVEQASELKSAFLANMSHEIRTPLTSIVGFADSIEDEVQSEDWDPETVARFAELIERSGHRLLDTLSAVLNLSMLEVGEMELELGPTDVEATLTEAAELHDIATSGVELDIQVSDPPLWARADPDALQVVLTNLIGNAVKFTPGEGRTIEGRAREDAGQILVEVEDPGIGMDPNEVSSLFEAFRQASSGLDRTHEGPGLGLTVTKRLLDLLGGTIEVETERGEGTCVTVRLPAASGDAT